VLAPVLANAGWGFPLLHDITDLIRIGDLTFVKPGKDPLTVEVKTRVLSEQRVEGADQVSLQYNIEVLSAAYPDDVREGPFSSLPMSDGPQHPPFRPTARIERQLKRLRTVWEHQSLELDIPVEIDGKVVIATEAAYSVAKTNWHAIKRVARRARRTGYAAESVEDTFVYAAFYDPDGLELERLNERFGRLMDDIIQSRNWSNDPTRKGSLIVAMLPSPEHEHAQTYLPYFLFAFPKNTVPDLLHGRMIILIMTNPSRITDALESAGFIVSIPTGRNDLSNESLVVSAEIDDGMGNPHQVEFRNLGRHVDQVMMEFGSAPDLVKVFETMRDKAQEVLIQRTMQTNDAAAPS
jgi:hypothetical protein